MRFLERAVHVLTARPLWMVLIGVVGSALSLQADGYISTQIDDEVALELLWFVNASMALGFILVASFSAHAAWFRGRHREPLAASRLAPVPDRPWETRHVELVGGLYLGSLRNCALVVGLTVMLLTVSTFLVDFGFLVFVASWLTALAAEVWRRIERHRAPSHPVTA